MIGRQTKVAKKIDSCRSKPLGGVKE